MGCAEEEKARPKRLGRAVPRWPTPAHDIAIQATIAQHFPQLAAPWVYKKLTRWYVYRVLLHGRDQYGQVKRPLDADVPEKLAKTWKEESAILEMLKQMAKDGFPIVGLEKAEKDLAKKYGREVR